MRRLADQYWSRTATLSPAAAADGSGGAGTVRHVQTRAGVASDEVHINTTQIGHSQPGAFGASRAQLLSNVSQPSSGQDAPPDRNAPYLQRERGSGIGTGRSSINPKTPLRSMRKTFLQIEMRLIYKERGAPASAKLHHREIQHQCKEPASIDRPHENPLQAPVNHPPTGGVSQAVNPPTNPPDIGPSSQLRPVPSTRHRQMSFQRHGRKMVLIVLDS